MRTLLLPAVTVLIALGAAPVQAADRLVVGFRDGVSSERQGAILRADGARVELRSARLRFSAVRARHGVRRDRLRRALGARPEVRYVETDHPVTLARAPGDPLFGEQWFHQRGDDHDIDSPAAWDLRTSCALVAVVDTGVTAGHPDLAPNLWVNGDEIAGNGKDDDRNGYVDDAHGTDVRFGGAPTDTNGHGTHVAGLVAGRGANGTGGTGVCWSGKVMAVKFMSALGRGSSADAAAAIEYAVRNGAKIVNASFGSSSASTPLHDAIRYAKGKGALVVVAAGNEGRNLDVTPSYPASWTDGNILTVAATTTGDKLASFSNYGDDSVDVAAPGDDLLSTSLRGYAERSGTSMAAPLVAGTAGLLRKEDPGLTYQQLKDLLRKQVDKPSGVEGKVVYDGRLNARKALKAAR